MAAPSASVPVPSAPQESSRPITFVAPRPISQVQPIIPMELRPLLSKGVEIQLRVSINAAGKVTAAEPVLRYSGLTEHLSRAAVYAAMQWRFSPAMQDGKPIPSDTVLRFRFGRN
jgi:outer membrane biosynthesis protein TonB